MGNLKDIVGSIIVGFGIAGLVIYSQNLEKKVRPQFHFNGEVIGKSYRPFSFLYSGGYIFSIKSDKGDLVTFSIAVNDEDHDKKIRTLDTYLNRGDKIAIDVAPPKSLFHQPDNNFELDYEDINKVDINGQRVK